MLGFKIAPPFEFIALDVRSVRRVATKKTSDSDEIAGRRSRAKAIGESANGD